MVYDDDDDDDDGDGDDDEEEEDDDDDDVDDDDANDGDYDANDDYDDDANDGDDDAKMNDCKLFTFTNRGCLCPLGTLALCCAAFYSRAKFTMPRRTSLPSYCACKVSSRSTTQML